MAEEKNVKKDRGRWFREMRSELKKVVWPSKEKVAKNTGTVILYSVIIGACIWIFDGVARSEERRVGKECLRRRGRPAHQDPAQRVRRVRG